MVSPAALAEYGFSTKASAFSTRVFALFSALVVHVIRLVSLALMTSLCSGGIATVRPLSRMTSTLSIRYCSSRRRGAAAADAREGPPLSSSSTSYTPRALIVASETAAARPNNRRRLVPRFSAAMPPPLRPDPRCHRGQARGSRPVQGDCPDGDVARYPRQS